VVVAAIDTGVFGDHEQLRGRMVPDGKGWLDPVEGRQEPYDSHGHGTSVLSLAVGANTAGRVVGVAPEARWAVALGNRDNYYSRSRMTIAADWVLRTVRPDVVINAWSDSHGECSRFDLPFINAWKAAEMFVVFPAGNSGPEAGTDESPANLTGTLPRGRPVFSTGGLDRDGAGLKVFELSSRGPNSCSGEPFPSLSAPGAELPFAYPPLSDGYGIGNGTSLAAGLVGGAAALLLEAAPELGPDELERILIKTARDLPPAGHDPDTGAGILDLAAALAEVRKR
jgi:subtilisin family serine protease